MAELKNSALLDDLIRYAQKQAGSGESYSVEALLLAACDCVEGTFSPDSLNTEEGRAERAELEKLLQERLDPVSVIREKLHQYVSQGGRRFLDHLYVKQVRMKIRDAAAPENGTLTAGLLLENILNSPTDTIKACLKSVKAAPPDPRFDLESLNQILGLAAGGPKEDGNDDNDDDDGDDNGYDDVEGEGDGVGIVSEPDEETGTTAPERSPEENRKQLDELVDRVKKFRRYLLETVKGQDNAVSVFTAGYFHGEISSLVDTGRSRPRATFLFAGPPGVGKTLLAETAADYLGLPYKRFDMSEYADRESVVELCGSDMVYKNSDRGLLTDFVDRNPRCLLLFDEIEKAHINAIHIFLQILDAGRLRDSQTDEEVSFRDTVIIFTTNAGRQLYGQSETGDYSTLPQKVVLNALRADVNTSTGLPFFPAAICSRFSSGNVVMFNHIGAGALYGITKKIIVEYTKKYAEQLDLAVETEDAVYSALLFAEGSAGDARAVTGRARAFVDDEMYELLRLLDNGKGNAQPGKMKKVSFRVELPERDPGVKALFAPAGTPVILSFAGEQTAAMLSAAAKGCVVKNFSEPAAALEAMENGSVNLVLAEIGFGRREENDVLLNAEDIDSTARDFFRAVKEKRPDLPVYLIRPHGFPLNAEELLSFMRQGVRGVLAADDGEESMRQNIARICTELYRQKTLTALASENKVLTYGTKQTVSDDGTEAQIVLYDLKIGEAIDAEDKRTVMSEVSRPDVHFADIIGAEDAKKELKFFVDVIKDPRKYLAMGFRIPKGAIFYGPPGTGKTMLAKATACEAGVSFIPAEGNQFLRSLVGEGEEMVHKLFRTARKYAPSIIFVDEIDAIAKERRGDMHAAANGESILTAFLAEMDGFRNDPTRPVLVLAATNFDVKPGSTRSLDAALMRRFDRKIYVDLPDREERGRYLRKKAAGIRAFEVTDAGLDSIALRSAGMSLAELELVIDFAMRCAIRNGDLRVTDAVLEEAFETFNDGEAKKRDEKSVLRTARHEAGHAFVCWLSGETPSYVTVVSRGDYGGYMQHDNENKTGYTRDELLALIRTALAGRAAELVFYGERDGVSTGASSDLAHATETARRYLCAYGMDETFGLAAVPQDGALSAGLSAEIRAAENRILGEQMKLAADSVAGGRNAVEALAQALLDKNHLTGPEIDRIFSENHPRP